MWLDGEVVHIDGHRLVDAGKQGVYDSWAQSVSPFPSLFFLWAVRCGPSLARLVAGDANGHFRGRPE